MEIFENQKPLSFDFDEGLDKAQISPNGFREYDARWIYPEEINKKGLEIFGYSLGKYISNFKSSRSKRFKMNNFLILFHDHYLFIKLQFTNF